MQDSYTQGGSEAPLWRRIFDYPLVTMLVAIALFACAIAAGLLIARILPPMADSARMVVQAAINIGGSAFFGQIALLVFAIVLLRLLPQGMSGFWRERE